MMFLRLMKNEFGKSRYLELSETVLGRATDPFRAPTLEATITPLTDDNAARGTCRPTLKLLKTKLQRHTTEFMNIR